MKELISKLLTRWFPFRKPLFMQVQETLRAERERKGTIFGQNDFTGGLK